MAQLGVFLLFLTIFTGSNCLQTLDLNGEWLLKDATEKYTDLKATVPGGIYTDLMNNNIIEDILYGYNDNVTRWVPRTNWTYYTNFTVDDELLSFENINVVFEGLDTISSIFINDVLIGKSQNMFVQYIFNIKNIVKSGVNTIEIQFQSPVEASAKLAEEQSYVIPPECPPDEYRGECHVNMLRKMQASFSWDWGPSFPSVGIWKNVFIEAYNQTVIRYVVTHVVDKNSDFWELLINVYFANNAKQRVIGTMTSQIGLEDQIIYSTRTDVDQQPNEHSEIMVTASINIPKGFVRTWWPNGYGEQNLYGLYVRLINGAEVTTINQTVGFRTVELIQKNITNGLSFYFKVNDVDIFMKGSNEIPIDVLPERGQNETVIKNLLKSAKDSHMNMLRVWGGGMYESDYFYNLADEYGILIWQDFMLACALYPSTEEFTSNVIEEVQHQVKRLKSHPSIVLFSGNNENEGALVDDWYHVKDNFTLYKKDYIKLYVDTIKVEFDRITNNSGLFVSSSPSNGRETEDEGFVAQHPGSSFFGDVHFYNYVLDSFNTNIYPIPRFASEFGYQSLPSVETLLLVTNNISDLHINSNFLDHRQHHPAGNSQMKLLIDYQLNLPKEDSPNYYKAFIFYSQIIQAMSTKIETEHYRMHKSIIDEKGQGLTMGALYWQLNDVWVAPTWSGIDYTGKWKMLQYFTKEFFAPLIITGEINVERQSTIYVVSDLTIPIFNCTAIVDVFKWDSLEPIANLSFTVDVLEGKSQVLTVIETDDYLSSVNCGSLSNAKNNCFFSLKLMNNGVNISPDNFLLPSKLKDSNLQQPNLKIDSVVDVGEGGTFEITLKVDKIAAFVWLDAHNLGGRFSENGFVQVNQTKTVYFNSEETVTVDDLKAVLTVTHLLDEEYK